MLDDVILLKDLTDHERLMFQNEYLAMRKSETTGLLLAFFFGGVGAHHFYLGHVGLGVLYLLFCWTFIPSLVALGECLLMGRRVRRYNLQTAERIVAKIKAPRATAT